MEKKTHPKYGFFNSAKEMKEDYKKHVASQPGMKEDLAKIRKKNREMVYGEGVRTRGKNAGLKKGTGKEKHSKEDLSKAHEHMRKHAK
jgi:hypothetical protein